MKKVNIRLYTKESPDFNKFKLIKLYMIKIERDLLEKFTSDGLYVDFENKEDLKKGLILTKKLYPNHKIIDEENLLEGEK